MDESSLVALWRHFNNANIIYQFYQNKIHHVHRRKISIVHSTTCRLLFIFYEQKKYYCYHRRCGLAKGKNLIAFHVLYVRVWLMNLFVFIEIKIQGKIDGKVFITITFLTVLGKRAQVVNLDYVSVSWSRFI